MYSSLRESLAYITGAVLLTALLLFQMQGPWLAFKVQQSVVRAEIKQQIKAGVPESDLVTLKIAKAWEQEPNHRFERKHSKEFRFDGEMYDIIRSEDVGDTTVYVCIHDVKESGLFAALEVRIQRAMNDRENHRKRTQIQERLAVKYCAAEASGWIIRASIARTYPSLIPGISEQSFDCDSPPPEGSCFIS